MELQGIIDMHIHAFPDVRERSIDDIGLVREAQRLGVRAVVIKSHWVPTMDRAWLMHKLYPDVAVFGGITLNPSVGGINPDAVKTAIKLGAKIVWLPTLFSERQRTVEGKADGVRTVINGKVVPELNEVLKLIAQENIILGTGHLTPQEIFIVVDAACKAGVRKILVNHPEHYLVNLSIKDQKTLAADYNVYFERCYAQPLGGGKYKTNFAVNLEAIKAVGYESTVIATDGGQVENPPWSEALRTYLNYLVTHGVSKEAIAVMTYENPARLLDLA
ncbi:DUF6282 family protein [Sporomusa acidovorans]|uniref:Cytosolic protein n=1 Tax=Sporomusa acidovorans (strain ATCC 49682 / DSM 3132 / Mol) TaxID=1123286 RepID=A0ABZ3J1W9_SPOA4|nr:DUF6282 family protein [Sporomusa acidovorans]OZC16548.1 hypothetical protein SPACI_42300 [Sporomusa acidovorans DSM 3132]SDF60982.1 hypothetical protein SAMN04488499_106218 [Sporomusa acidovorans]